MCRAVLGILAATVAVFVLGSGAAWGGGWAVTTLDQLPPDFRAGEAYALGYTIRQHGQTPVRVDDTRIRIAPVGGETLSFPGRPEGAVGHYLATVTFPQSGSYRWEVTQGAFATQDLGTLTVLPAGAAPAAVAPLTPARSTDPVRAVLPYAAAVAAALFAWRLVWLVGMLRRRVLGA